MIPLTHMHIPKTAGASLLTILRLQYGDDVLAIPARDWEKVTPEQAQAHTAISGHFPYHAPQRWEIGPHRTITFLREPLARIGSLYAYIHGRGRAHRAWLQVSGMSPQEFAERGPFDNCQTRMLAEREDFQWFHELKPLTANDLSLAKFNLDHTWFVGDVATFRQDVYRLQETLGWAAFAVPHIHASLSRPHIELTEAVKAKWKWDLELYSSFSRNDNRAWDSTIT